jgi:DNA-binding transcriptional MocR family regulator
MLPDIQLFLRPGIIELGWGHPDPALFPVADLAAAAARALAEAGPQALAYGAEQGPGRLIEPLAAWLAQREGRPVPAEQVLITGGASQALDLLCTLWTRPGDTVLVEAPVYHLALRILRDHGLRLVPVAGDAHGLCPDALEAVLARESQPPRFLYTVPTFSNPSGATLPLERRQAVVSMAAAQGVPIVEDDVYRFLWFDEPPPPSLYHLAPAGAVIHLGSFSKILAPGLRLGWLVAAPEVVKRCVRSGLLDSGGGVSHFAAHVVAAYLEQGLLDGHIERLRAAYARRRDVLTAALAHYLPEGCHWERPRGGFFAWVALPAGIDSAGLLPAAEAAGVSYVPGARFYVDGGGGRYLRLSFSLLPTDELEEGVRRLAEVVERALKGVREERSP